MDDDEEFVDLKTVQVNNNPLYEPVCTVDTQDAPVLGYLGVRALLVLAVFFGVSLLSPDLLKSDSTGKRLPVHNGKAFLVYEISNIRPWNRLVRVEFSQATDTLVGKMNVTFGAKSGIWTEQREVRMSHDRDGWFEIFESDMLTFQYLKLELEFEAPAEGVVVAIKRTWAPDVSAIFDTFCRFAFSLSNTLISWHFNADILNGQSAVEIERVLMVILSLGVGFWNDFLFSLHYLSPSKVYLIYDSVVRDCVYGLIMFIAIALLNIIAIPEGGAVKPALVKPVVFGLAFALYRSYVDVTNPVPFDKRPESFGDSITLIFLCAFFVYYVATLVTTGQNKRDCYVMRHKVYTISFSATFGLWIVLWFTHAVFHDARGSAAFGMMPYVFVNSFYVAMQLLHDNESKAGSLYQLPGEGNDQENPFDLLEDNEPEAEQDQGIQFGALGLI